MMNMHAIDHEPAEDSSHYRRIARAVRFLAENYRDQPTLEEAAGAAGLSPFHFQRLFSRHVGVSPKSFVANLTLGHAKTRLAQGASVLEAALDSGLSGPSRLHDLCLKIEAMTPGEFAREGRGLHIAHGFCDSPFGRTLVMSTVQGVCGLAFADEEEMPEALTAMKSRWPQAEYFEDAPYIEVLGEKIFAPQPGGHLTLHLIGTRWQIKVWQALLAIPPGTVVSYRTIAQHVRNAHDARAVGGAVGSNPIAWLIPCHRVLASDGTLHGYHWGLARKRSMLAVEAARKAA
jgi:AraC family transcriptional regulator of adaptative response/methylated-DNA-[protein]-cysteine methyltransferase